MIDRNSVEIYLGLVQRALSSGGLLIFSNREKNLAFIKQQGLTIAEVKDCISCLSIENYSSGPLSDNSDGNRNDVWIFGTRMSGVEVYIKISFGDSLNTVICISFHESEQAMCYPYGGENEND